MVDTGKMNYIIRDHDKELFEAKKAFFLQAGQTLKTKSMAVKYVKYP